MKPRTKCICCGCTPILVTGRCKSCEKEILEWVENTKGEANIPLGCYRSRDRGAGILEHLVTELDKR